MEAQNNATATSKKGKFPCHMQSAKSLQSCILYDKKNLFYCLAAFEN